MVMFRHPRTYQEKRHAGRLTRGKRRPINLPDERDDRPVAARKDRCWKRFRKHQWRAWLS